MHAKKHNKIHKQTIKVGGFFGKFGKSGKSGKNRTRVGSTANTSSPRKTGKISISGFPTTESSTNDGIGKQQSTKKNSIYENPAQFRKSAKKSLKQISGKKTLPLMSRVSSLFRRQKEQALPLEEQIRRERQAMPLPELPAKKSPSEQNGENAKEKVSREASNITGKQVKFDDLDSWFKNLKTSVELQNTTHPEIIQQRNSINRISQYLAGLKYSSNPTELQTREGFITNTAPKQILNPNDVKIMYELYSKYGNQKINTMQKQGITEPTYVEMRTPAQPNIYESLDEALANKSTRTNTNLTQEFSAYLSKRAEDAPTVNRQSKRSLPGSSLSNNNFTRTFSTSLKQQNHNTRYAVFNQKNQKQQKLSQQLKNALRMKKNKPYIDKLEQLKTSARSNTANIIQGIIDTSTFYSPEFLENRIKQIESKMANNVERRKRFNNARKELSIYFSPTKDSSLPSEPALNSSSIPNESSMSLLTQLRGSQLRPISTSSAAPASARDSGNNSRNSLLASIRKGKQLRHVQQPPSNTSNRTSSQLSGMAKSLSSLIKSGTADSQSAAPSSDNSEWNG